MKIFELKKFPFFYGWVVLIVGSIGLIMSIPGQTMGVSVFTDYLIEALNISRIELSIAYMFGTLSSAFFITYAGRLYDKYGARIIGASSAVLLGIVLLGLSRSDHMVGFLQRVFNGIPANIITLAFMIILFFLLRFSGQGVLTMVSRNMIMKWFDKRRGLANGIMGFFMSIGFSISPIILNMFIEENGWRGAWVILAAIIGLGFAIIAILTYRDNPMQYGLIPDGKLISRVKKKAPLSTSPKDYKLKEAIKTYSFWIFNLSMMMNALFITAFTFHVVDIFKEAGMDRLTAISVFFPTAIIAVIFHFGGGWLSDYIKLKYFLILNLLGLSIGMFGIMFLDTSIVTFIIIIIGNGISGGMFGILSSVTWPRFYGLKHLGSISGFAMAWMVAGSAVAPFIFSLSIRYTGVYAYGAGVCLLVTLILLILSFKANNVND